MEKPLAVRQIGVGGAVSLGLKNNKAKKTKQVQWVPNGGRAVKHGDGTRLYGVKCVCVCGSSSVCAKCVMMQVSPGYRGMKMQTRLLKQKKGGRGVFMKLEATHIIDRVCVCVSMWVLKLARRLVDRHTAIDIEVGVLVWFAAR